MIIVSVLNEKGGAGKTTISTNLACSLSSRGHKVLLVDSDPQGSARDWYASASDDKSLPTTVGLDRPSLFKDLITVAGNSDFVVVDGAPQVRDLAVAAIKVSDRIIIPVQPSPYDIWAAESLVELIKARQEITNGKPHAAFLISRQIKGTKLAGEAREAIVGYGLPIMKACTTQRVLFPNQAAIGDSVLGTNSEAEKEINNITDEVLSWGH